MKKSSMNMAPNGRIPAIRILEERKEKEKLHSNISHGS